MKPDPLVSGPTATVSLTAYLMPEGTVSHYEIQGRSIKGDLTFFRAQSSRGAFLSDGAYVETEAYLAAVIGVALSDLVSVYGVQGTITDAPEGLEGV